MFSMFAFMKQMVGAPAPFPQRPPHQLPAVQSPFSLYNSNLLRPIPIHSITPHPLNSLPEHLLYWTLTYMICGYVHM